MDNSIIKIMLENKKPKAYSLIVQLHFDKIELYKPSVFKIWLSKEIGISDALIHEASISAAMIRYKKKMSKAKTVSQTREKVGNSDNGFNTEIPNSFPGFK